MISKTKNTTGSVRARLLNIAKQNNRNFNAVLLQYFQERMLYRLSISAYKHNFVLKGALLFIIYDLPRARPTKDIDFLGTGTANTTDNLVKIMKQVLGINVEDGVKFDTSKIAAEEIKQDESYQGIRIFCEAYLGQVRMRFRFDVGFGDTITPKPVMMDFPTLLENMSAPRISAYTPETAIAEKLEAIVRFGFANSRMKDFFDIDHLSSNHTFDSDILSEAIRVTFTNRQTDIAGIETVFSDEFKYDKAKNIQWEAFMKKNNIDSKMSFTDCMLRIERFVRPILGRADVSKQWDTKRLIWIES